MEFKNVSKSQIIEEPKCGSDIHNDISVISNNVTNNDINNSLHNTDTNSTITEEVNDGPNNYNNTLNIYRYKFTNEFTEELFKFSKVHQYDHRHDFKDAWKVWMDDNSEILEEEIRRLHNLGYEGDIVDKMFKSARYYFRKKDTEKKEPSKRRVYVGSQKDLLEEMDEHIKTLINSGECKPSDGFDEFCKENKDLLKEQITLLLKSGFTNSNEIKAKIKKTYKNRYFLIANKKV